MWHFFLSPFVLVTTLLYTQTIAARTQVRKASTLGLKIHEQPDDDYVRIVGPGGFDAEVKVDKNDRRLVVANIDNPGRRFKAREALLSVWEHQSGTSASNLRQIKYFAISEPSVVAVLDSIWGAHDIDVEEEDHIDAMTVKRPGTGEEDWRFSNLRNKNAFGSGAVSMCLDYKEMEDHYIDSFTFGRQGYDGRWLEINFGVK